MHVRTHKLSRVNNDFLLVQNCQKWFKNYCPQINQIKQIFVVDNYQQLKTIFGNPLQNYYKLSDKN